MGTGAALVPKLFRYPLRVEMMANLHGLVFGIVRGHVPNSWQLATIIVLSLVVLVWTAVWGPRINIAPRQLVLAILCSVLVSYYAFAHDLSVLLIPVVVMLNVALRSEVWHMRGRDFHLWAVVLVFVAPIIQAFFPNYLFLASLAVSSLLVSAALSLETETDAPR